MQRLVKMSPGYLTIVCIAYPGGASLSEKSRPDAQTAAAANDVSPIRSVRSAIPRLVRAMSGFSSRLAGYDEDCDNITSLFVDGDEATEDEGAGYDAHKCDHEEAAASVGFVIAVAPLMSNNEKQVDSDSQFEPVDRALQADGEEVEKMYALRFEEKLKKQPASDGWDYLNHASTRFSSKESTPLVPQPQTVRGSLTEVLCNWYHRLLTPLRTPTLDTFATSLAEPHLTPCVLLLHFKVGLNSVEAIIQSHTQILETIERKTQRVECL